MKKSSFILGLFFMASMAMAQEKSNRSHDRFERLKTELQLNEQQSEAIKELLHAQRIEMKAHRKQHALNDENLEHSKAERATERKAKHEAFRADLSTILDEEQLAKYDQMVKKRRAKMKQHRMDRTEQPDNKPYQEYPIDKE